MTRYSQFSMLLGAMALSVMNAGFATAADAVAADTQPGDQQDTALQEVTVTAERRTEDVQKVPASISVIGGAALQDNHIVGIEDISRAVPGVSFGSGGGPGLDNIEMRGVSSTSGSATVGIYLDDVPITVKNLYNGAVEPRLFDMDRVEVLRGPQGTLYGASSEGGAIRFISNQPDLKNFSVSASSEGSGTDHGGGNYEERVVVNTPLVDGRAALRFGVDVGEQSGWIDNLGCCGTSIPGVPVTDAPVGSLVKSDVNNERWAVARLSGKIAVDDSLTITPAMYAEWDKSGDTSVYYPQVGLYEQEKEVPEPINNRLLIGSVTIAKELGFAQLSSISSYFQQDLDRIQDGTFYNSVYFADYLIPAVPGVPGGYTNPNTYLIGQLPSPQLSNTWTRTMSQEFRFTSSASPDGKDKFSWVTGLFISQYDSRNSNYQSITNFTETFTNIYGVAPGDSAVTAFQGATFPNNSLALFNFRLREQQFAAFGNVTYSPIENLKLTAGVRENYAPGYYKQDLAASFFTGPTPVELDYRTHFNSITPKFSIAYDATDDLNLYASAAKGDRLGGGNYYIPVSVCGEDLANLGLTTAPTNYNTDTLWSYEGGLKGRFLNNSLSINLDGYYVRWRNIQQTIDLPICGSQLTVNIGDAKSYGPELELNYEPLAGLTFGVSSAYTKATITDINPLYQSFGVNEGQSVLNVPEWMASFRISYTHPVTGNLKVLAKTDYNFTGPSYGSFTVDNPSYRQPEYSIMNGSLGFSYKNYEVSLFAKNLLNSSKVIQIPDLLFVPEAYSLRPLTVGVLLKAEF
jgi:iron complex outermembrane receptor protein